MPGDRVPHILDEVERIIDQTRTVRPLVVHHTNVVVANDSANITLAVGGSPLMSLAEEEQADLASIASAFLLNIGTVNNVQRQVILAAAEAARAKSKPVILDPVGVGATKYRQEVTREVLHAVRPTVIKGNAGEIAYLAGTDSTLPRGLDSGTADATVAPQLALSLALTRRTVVILHGPIDYITDGEVVVELSNGSSRLAQITGTGCSLGSVVATYAGAVFDRAKGEGEQSQRDVLVACVAGVLAVSVAGELAAEATVNKGSASFKAEWIDQLSRITGAAVRERARVRLLDVATS